MLRRQQKRLRGEKEEKKKLEQEAAEALINPMLNDTVLTGILKVCSLKDLPQFRLVSKKWHSLSLPILRKEMTLRIDLLDFDCNDTYGDGRRYVARIKKMQIGDHPFETCSFRGFKFQHNGIGPETQLWDTFCPWIRKLTLNHGVVYCVRALQQLIFELTPNLEELSMTQFDFRITNCSSGECEMPQYPEKGLRKDDLQLKLKSLVLTSGMTPFPISWDLMFDHFPNIERIHFHAGFTSTRDFIPFVEALEDKTKKWSSTQMIKDMKFDSRFNDDDCTSAAERLLRLPHMQLEALSIICRKSEEDADRTDVLPLALQIHGRNLKKLEIQNGRMVISKNEIDLEPYLDFPFQGGSFDSMTELTLEGVIASNLHFLLQLPNLKVLLIRQNREERILGGTDFKKIKNLVLPHVRHLEFRVFNTTEFELSEDNMKMFVKIMPNVDNFEGNLMPPGLRVVCRNWRRMVKLDIFVNAASTGQESENNELYEPLFKWQGKSVPNIKKLDDLRKELTQGVVDDPATAWTGFKELTFLKTLNVKIISRVKTGTRRRV